VVMHEQEVERAVSNLIRFCSDSWLDAARHEV